MKIDNTNQVFVQNSYTVSVWDSVPPTYNFNCGLQLFRIRKCHTIQESTLIYVVCLFGSM